MPQKRFLTLSLGFVGLLALISLYSCKKKNSITETAPTSVTDYDGNVYKPVKIGNQVWMVGALKVTHYNDGTRIPYVPGNTWITTTEGARCYYEDERIDPVQYAAIYGALYNCYAVSHKGIDGKPNLAPKGWHIADTTEWDTLIGTLNSNPNFRGGNDATVGGMLKETDTTHWLSPNTGATNSSGFKALPAGFRHNLGSFNHLGYYAYYWSSTEISSNDAYCQKLNYANAEISRVTNIKSQGLSVVCIKD